MIDKARELLDLIRMRRDSLTLDGRDGQGVTPPAPEQSTTWIVTQVEQFACLVDHPYFLSPIDPPIREPPSW